MKTVLELKHISKLFGDYLVLKNLSLSLKKGQIGCLLGPSGCGKTTVLRTIAGFEDLDAGEILINGSRVSTINTKVPTEARRVGMVFQDYALFPHLNVSDNIGFGLLKFDQGRKKGPPKVEHLG